MGEDSGAVGTIPAGASRIGVLSSGLMVLSAKQPDSAIGRNVLI
jgi:hypothetical protein